MTPDEKQVIDRLKQATNILVTVNSNPSIDQLAACLGLTLALNKSGKHATAVFSGEVPSILEFLQPEKTLEKNTDSLRDFIISLDKSKADKLRYKVEDNVVKIFITPYRTAITEKDFEYSQGDFNVEAVVALGVRSQQELDEAITAHGRILHDATVICINNQTGSELGTLNVTDPTASSLSELVAILLQSMDKESIDNQIATALLTGVVAETERFSNEKTTPTTMSVSSVLMAAGANQQLVATKLEEHVVPQVIAEPISAPVETPPQTEVKEVAEVESEQPVTKPKEPGTLEIAHNEPEPDAFEDPEPEPEHEVGQIQVDENGQIKSLNQEESSVGNISEPAPGLSSVETPELPSPVNPTTAPNRMILQPPSMQPSNFTANSEPEQDSVSGDITLPAVASEGESAPDVPEQSTLTRKPFNLSEALAQNQSQNNPVSTPFGQEATDSENANTALDNQETLAQIEQDVQSPHVVEVSDTTLPDPAAPLVASDGAMTMGASSALDPELDSARKAVEDAMAGLPTEQQSFNPVAALNADTVDLNAPADPTALQQSETATTPGSDPLGTPQPAFGTPPVYTAPTQQQPPVSQYPEPQQEFTLPQPQFQSTEVTTPQQVQQFDPNAAPPLPPPMMPRGLNQ